MQSAQRTTENSPAIYRWEAAAFLFPVREADGRVLAREFCRPLHGLSFFIFTPTQR
jgi:hypothetical protein